jgi:hypothetical protein
MEIDTVPKSRPYCTIHDYQANKDKSEVCIPVASMSETESRESMQITLDFTTLHLGCLLIFLSVDYFLYLGLMDFLFCLEHLQV